MGSPLSRPNSMTASENARTTADRSMRKRSCPSARNWMSLTAASPSLSSSTSSASSRRGSYGHGRWGGYPHTIEHARAGGQKKGYTCAHANMHNCSKKSAFVRAKKHAARRKKECTCATRKKTCKSRRRKKTCKNKKDAREQTKKRHVVHARAEKASSAKCCQASRLLWSGLGLRALAEWSPVRV